MSDYNIPMQTLLAGMQALNQAAADHDERERRNTLTLATISQMVGDILELLRKPANPDSPLHELLRHIVAQNEAQLVVLGRLETRLAHLDVRL